MCHFLAHIPNYLCAKTSKIAVMGIIIVIICFVPWLIAALNEGGKIK